MCSGEYRYLHRLSRPEGKKESMELPLFAVSVLKFPVGACTGYGLEGRSLRDQGAAVDRGRTAKRIAVAQPLQQLAQRRNLRP